MASVEDIYDRLQEAQDALSRVSRGLDTLEPEVADCDSPHCDDWSCICGEDSTLAGLNYIVEGYLRHLRMGWDVPSLEDILEEIRRELSA